MKMKMELPGKKPTHDFLSLYTHPSSISEPRPSQGNYLKTHDFLGTGEKTVETSEVDKPIDSPPSSSVEHILPGGIGTYTIRHIPNFNQRAPKTEQPGYTLISADKNIEAIKPNTTSKGVGPGSFRLWGDSGTKDKGVTVAHAPIDKPVIREAATVENLGQWSSERSLPAHPLPSFIHRSTATTTTATSSSFTNSRSSSKQKNQSFMEMMKSGRGLQEDEEDDEEEFLSKKTTPSSSNKDGKSGEQRANTPRSKHSATEQRRRSKINDRFQILRDLIPQNDQKRDKASFLLEVIDYIKFLQEKVNKYETSYQGWNQEPTKLTPWRNGHAPVDTIVDPPRVINSVPVPALVYTGKFDDNNITDSPAMLIGAQNLVEPDLSTVTANKGMEHHPGLESKGFPVPLPLQPNMVSPFGRIGGLAQPPHQSMSDAENMALHPQPHLWQDGLCADDCPMTSDAMHEQEVLPMEGGTISISDVYSQGLLNNLTQALQSSGVDLSQANISVQVDYGKRAINRLTTTSGVKNEHDEPASNQAMLLPKFEGNGEDSDQARKRPRVG